MFIRKYKLTLGAADKSQPLVLKQGVTSMSGSVVITDLHIRFRIKRTSDAQHDTCEIEIYNLSKDTIAVFDKDDVLVQLEVGYRDQPLQMLFRGTKTFMTTSKEEADVKTTVTCADGFTITREGSVAVSNPSGTNLKTVITSIVNNGMKSADGTSTIKTVEFQGGADAFSKVYQNGFSAVGAAAKQLQSVCDDNNLTYTITNNDTLTIWPKDKDNKYPATVLTPDNGLISSPESMSQEIQKLKNQGGTPSESGVRFKCLLNPSLIAGSNVKIQGTFNRDGVYTVQSVTHTGGYESEEWYTEIEATNAGLK